jgi:hypothetical protein
MNCQTAAPCPKLLRSRIWSHPPESNWRPTDYESTGGYNRNREDPSILRDFSALSTRSMGLFGSLGEQFSDRRRTYQIHQSSTPCTPDWPPDDFFTVGMLIGFVVVSQKPVNYRTGRPGGDVINDDFQIGGGLIWSDPQRTPPRQP